MRFSVRTHSLRCTACEHTEQLPPHCPHCKSHDIRFSGVGIEKVANTLRLLFPNVSVVEMSMEKKTSKEEDSNIEKDIQTHIIIGTSHAFQQHWEWFDRIGCIGIILGDPLQSLIDFRSLEYQWQTLMRLRALATTFGITTVVQSFDPTSLFIQTLYRADWKEFCDWQEAMRKRFSWPPYSRLVKIIARHHTALIPDASEMLMKKMRTTIAPMKHLITLFRTSSMRSLQRPYFLIRINRETGSIDPLPRELETFFNEISDDWLIDIDPVTF